MIFNLDDKAVADDTILVFGIQYVGSNSGRAYTYAGMKAGGRWYFTGSGRTPQDASWPAVQRWLDSDGRRVVWVKVAGHFETLWTTVPGEGKVDLSPASETRDAVEHRLAAHRHDRRTDSWHLGAGHQGTSRMVAEQNGDDPYDLGEPPGGNDPDHPEGVRGSRL